MDEGEGVMSKKMKKICVSLSIILILSIAAASFVIAYAGGVRGIGLLGISFFLTAGILVVLGQLIPAGILFSLMVKSAFSSFRKGAMPVRV
jgi:hypothetical protein